MMQRLGLYIQNLIEKWFTLSADLFEGLKITSCHVQHLPNQLSFELGKTSFSLTEAEEEAVAREVHATHARIVSGPDPEPMQEDQTDQTLENYMCLLLDQTAEHMMMNTSRYPTQRFKSANRNTANYYLYHALIEALIADEDAMDKEVADKVKDHKRKHDSDDMKTKIDDEASQLEQTRITDTRDAVVDSLMHISDPESEQSKQSSDDILIKDEGHVSDLEDTNNAHIPKVSTTTSRTGKKKLCKADLEGPAFNLVKAFHKNNVFLQYQMDECHKLLTNKFLEWEAELGMIMRKLS
ncbi:hypothetical protein Tco_0629279 [Tanacetum coccineum]|uniref:Uncharacterized protein n=1 Tax=Tanacetum coccineum TaxID=301880 RepID=A0ABQ4WSS3_9ASTR